VKFGISLEPDEKVGKGPKEGIQVAAEKMKQRLAAYSGPLSGTLPSEKKFTREKSQ